MAVSRKIIVPDGPVDPRAVTTTNRYQVRDGTSQLVSVERAPVAERTKELFQRVEADNNDYLRQTGCYDLSVPDSGDKY